MRSSVRRQCAGGKESRAARSLSGIIGLVHYGPRRELLAVEGGEAALQVIRQRRGVVHRVGMEPDACGTVRPRDLHGGGQEMSAEPAAGELRKQSEVHDFNTADPIAAQ